MKTYAPLALVALFTPLVVLRAEEVLSTRPVVIAPKRIDTETTIPGKAAKRSAPKPVKEEVMETPVAEEKSNLAPIDEKNILLKISFKRGSIQLSQSIRKQLMGLGLKPGQKIRITGFGEKGMRKADRIANLRARVVASFLGEAVGDVSASLQWSGNPHASIAEGAVLEAVN